MSGEIRTTKYLNNGWLFAHEWQEEMASVACSEEEMEKVRLPHSNTQLSYNYLDEGCYQQLMGYRLHFASEEAWKGKRVLLTFEGVAHQAEVYLNGVHIASHNTGYTAFDVDITEGLREGDNVLSLRVDSRETLNTPPFGKVIDYMTYGGIYREVYLTIHETTWLKDVYALPVDVKKNSATLSLDLTVAQPAEEMEALVTLAGGEDILKENRFPCTGEHTQLRIPARNFRLWDVDDPFLYDLRVTLLVKGEAVDAFTCKTGFRSASFRENGFFLNGRRLKIRGLDRHQAYPYVGYAMPKSMQEMDARVLKEELGLNAVRTAHYPQSQHFLNACDALGLLVFTEMPGWQHIGDEAWKDQAVQNVEEMVLQYRNHPSIILWGVRINESMDDDAFYTRTNEVAHRLDPYRPTGGVRYIKKSHLLEDVYTYNDFVHEGNNRGVEKLTRVTPDPSKPYLISEYNGHMYPTKSFDDEPHRRDHALRHAKVLNDAMAQKGISGTFGWCMADYHTHQDFGSGDRICYHGVLDMFRNPKLAAAVYASQMPSEKQPVLQVSSSMDIGDSPAGLLGPVTVFTNAERVAVYKNGEKIREFDHTDTRYPNLPQPPMEVIDFIGDQLETKEGYPHQQAEDLKKVLLDAARYGMNNLSTGAKLRAARLMVQYKMTFEDAADLYGKYVGNWGAAMTEYRFDALVGDEVVASVTRQPVKSVALSLISDPSPLCEGETYDVREVRLRAVDQNNNVLPYYQEPLLLSVEGPAELIGPSMISLKGGMGGTYLRTTGEAGAVTLTVKGNEVTSQSLTLQVVKKDEITSDQMKSEEGEQKQ